MALSRRSDADSGILGFEFDATILALCVICVLDIGPSPAGLLCVDNQGVLDSLIKGSSTSAFGAAMCGVFWNLAARSSLFVWLGRVSSSANYADFPSRLCGLGGVVTSPYSRRQCPRTFLAIFSSFGNSHAAASGFGPDRLHVVPGAWSDCFPTKPGWKETSLGFVGIATLAGCYVTFLLLLMIVGRSALTRVPAWGGCL